MHQVLISHGLGNQLFQYAFAHFIQSEIGTPVRVENVPVVSRLGHGKRGSMSFKLYDLLNEHSELNFKLNRVVSNYSCVGRLAHRSGLAPRIQESRLKSREFVIWREEREVNSFKFLPMQLDRSIPPTSFRGFFQHWKYVFPNELKIRTELSQNLNNSVLSIASVSHNPSCKLLVVHLRRGDFFIRERPKIEGIVTLESYKKIITQLRGSYENLKVVTLTDSTQSLKKEGIDETFGTILGPEEASAWQSLKLMASANFFISANSTLSWWGAFLSLGNGGRVFIPTPFYRNLEIDGAFDYPGMEHYSSNFYSNLPHMD